MKNYLCRREFLKIASLASTGIILSGCGNKVTSTQIKKASSISSTVTSSQIKNINNSGRPWRPFSNTSPWNTPIENNPEIDPDSDTMIETMRMSISKGHFGINYNAWTIPIYIADNKTPTYNVPCINSWGGDCGIGYGENVPIPNDAMPDPMDDHHMVVVDLHRQKSWDMWGVHQVEGGWETGSGFVFDLTGIGVQPDGIGSTRASGFPLLAGLIRLDEIQYGYMDHALVMAYDSPRSNMYVYPASMSVDRGSPNAIPEGGRIQLDPKANLDLFVLSPAGKVIARALQEYGAYLGDAADGIVLYAEGLYGKRPLTWDGILNGDDIASIPLEYFRVLKLPPIKKNAW